MTESRQNRWTNVGNPTAIGWYAILYCYDMEEGIFPAADYWTGLKWSEGLPLCSYSEKPFETISEAYAWADENEDVR